MNKIGLLLLLYAVTSCMGLRSVIANGTDDASVNKEVDDGVEKIKNSTKTTKEVETDQISYVGKKFYLDGTLEPSSYYNYRYRNAQADHLAFRFKDAEGSEAVLYMARGIDADKVRERLLKSKKPVRGLFAVTILHDRYDSSSGSPLLAEITQAEFYPDE